MQLDKGKYTTLRYLNYMVPVVKDAVATIDAVVLGRFAQI